MNKARLYFVGDAVLRMRATPVGEIDDNIRKTLDSMESLMRAERGAGLAAPQVGVLLRMIVFAEERDGKVHKAINPKIISRSAKLVVMNEGCLSVQGPGGPVFADVERPESIVMEWADENGAPHREELGGIAARVVQHEVDHLDGILFIDYLSSAKREMVMRKVRKKRPI